MLLLIDNFDSFTHNLARYFTELGANVEVVRNNALTLDDISRLAPSQLVISPGPCTPNEAGISLSAIEYFAGKIPILGVCLGHQAIGQVFGAKVVGAQEIKHGKVSALSHRNSGLFKDLPNTFNVTRYHSLVLDPTSLPSTINVDAWCETVQGTKEIMAISHASYPVWGVQYHPESLLTEHGHSVLEAFLRSKTV
ncbi:MAG TPA: aminodeoxychorismate/anthranilate synthase component II [Alteromonas macleodii]|nr:aminodeoxychorismate/anthranilate synthase component II [Alteromonas macleodii]MAN43951.1 aminodeoxychorismate/anthranilate synthase component II [Alteromonas sp.]MAW03238.1 aminodeoxychorismate/anthranilate synthase component II [Alteromonas sp.]HBN97791.1 aminodeoxychorismate/anthranilate synthase component II [Alteromonas macleodii]